LKTLVKEKAMKRVLSYFSVIIGVCALVSSPACKKWEGRYYIQSAACETGYDEGTNESKFAVGIEVGNQESNGVGAVFSDWDFEVYDEDEELLVKINRANYDTLDFLVTVYAETPIPDSSRTGFPGLINVLTGNTNSNWRVPLDIFNAKTPKKLKYTLTIFDANGYTSTLSGELTIKHSSY